MRRLLALIAFAALAGCASKRPAVPDCESRLTPINTAAPAGPNGGRHAT